jgi:hypothetical protein
MRPAHVFLLVAAACFALSSIATGQVSTKELLQILKIHTWRIRVPSGAHQVWDIRAIKEEQLHAQGNNPRDLTEQATYLLAFREVDENKLEFTLPELKGSSQGIQDLCELGADCKRQYELHWNILPRYSADGEQCVIGELTNTFGDQGKLFVTLVRVKNVPE